MGNSLNKARINRYVLIVNWFSDIFLLLGRMEFVKALFKGFIETSVDMEKYRA